MLKMSHGSLFPWHIIIEMEMNHKQDELNKILLVKFYLIFIAQGLQIEKGKINFCGSL
jgi:hypothetical protein